MNIEKGPLTNRSLSHLPNAFLRDLLILRLSKSLMNESIESFCSRTWKQQQQFNGSSVRFAHLDAS